MTYTTRGARRTYVPPVLPGGSQPGLQTLNYTAMDALSSQTLQNGAGYSLTRDPSSGRLSQATVGTTVYTYGYHPTSGRLTSMTGSDGSSLAFSYDGALTRSLTWGGTSSPVTGVVGLTYNNDLNVSSFTIGGQQVALWTYDRDQLLTGAGTMTVIRHPQTGDVTSTTLGAITTSSSYDALGQVSTFQALRSGASFFQYEVTQRDRQGRIVELVETSNGVRKVKGYRYDALGRLHEVLLNGTSESIYSYDANGNRSSHESAGDTDTGSYDAQDRIESYSNCSYTMDAAGFLADRNCGAGMETFQYDARGSLVQATRANGDVIGYILDPQGRRIGRRVNGALDKGWLYLDGLRPVAQLNGAGQLETIFVYGTRTNIPEYIIEKTSGGDVLHRVVADHLGTPRQIVRSNDGLVVHELDVDEWGNVTHEAGTKQELHPFGFAGGLRDRATGLVRFGARDYEPETGRWTARDPVLFGGDDTNLYAYVANDPVNFVDPHGLMKLPANPGGLGPDWTLDPTHRNPNGQRWRHPSGDYLDFHPGDPSKPKGRRTRYDREDHWHLNGEDWHRSPGDEIPDPAPIREDEEYSPGPAEEDTNEYSPEDVPVPILIFPIIPIPWFGPATVPEWAAGLAPLGA